MARGCPTANQDTSSQQEINLLAPRTWNVQPPELWEILFCGLSYLDYGVFVMATQMH